MTTPSSPLPGLAALPLSLGASLSVSLVLALSFAFSSLGCTSALADIVGSVNIDCSTATDAGESACILSKNLPSSEQSSAQNECTNSGGKIVASCPTAGLVGCCTQTEAEVTIESCYYMGTAAALKSQCSSGTWSTSQ